MQEEVSGFGSACKERLAGPGEREAVIRRPIEDLLQAVGRLHKIDATLPHDEVSLSDIGVRPDYAIAVNGAIVGYIEVKRPGRGLDPDKFTRRPGGSGPDMPYAPSSNPRDPTRD